MLSFLSGRELERADLGRLLFKRLRVQGTTLCACSVPYQANLVQRFTHDVVGKLTGAEGHRKQPRSSRRTLGTYL
jgi:hypothetical protein